MNLTPTQMVIIGACLLVGYLTWSAVQGQNTLVDESIPRVMRPASKGDVVIPVVKGRGRDPFLKMSEMGRYDTGPELPTDETGSGPLRLTGVIAAGRDKIAYVNGKRLREGDQYRGYEVQSIELDRISLASGDEQLNLWLDSLSGAAKEGEATTPAPVRKGKGRIEIIHRAADAAGPDADPADGEHEGQPQVEEAEGPQ